MLGPKDQGSHSWSTCTSCLPYPEEKIQLEVHQLYPAASIDIESAKVVHGLSQSFNTEDCTRGPTQGLACAGFPQATELRLHSGSDVTSPSIAGGEVLNG